MKNIQSIILYYFIMTGMFFSMPVCANTDAVGFTQKAYQAILNYQNGQNADHALSSFKEYFSFDDFGNKVMTDLATQLSEQDKTKILDRFNKVFFKNLFDKSQKIFSHMIKNPVYSVREIKEKHSIILITGQSLQKENASMAFYIKQVNQQEWKVIDIEIESALLSRNYRSSFNRIYRDHGFPGLYERLLKN